MQIDRQAIPHGAPRVNKPLVAIRITFLPRSLWFPHVWRSWLPMRVIFNHWWCQWVGQQWVQMIWQVPRTKFLIWIDFTPMLINIVTLDCWPCADTIVAIKIIAVFFWYRFTLWVLCDLFVIATLHLALLLPWLIRLTYIRPRWHIHPLSLCINETIRVTSLEGDAVGTWRWSHPTNDACQNLAESRASKQESN